MWSAASSFLVNEDGRSVRARLSVLLSCPLGCPPLSSPPAAVTRHFSVWGWGRWILTSGTAWLNTVVYGPAFRFIGGTWLLAPSHCLTRPPPPFPSMLNGVRWPPALAHVTCGCCRSTWCLWPGNWLVMRLRVMFKKKKRILYLSDFVSLSLYWTNLQRGVPVHCPQRQEAYCIMSHLFSGLYYIIVPWVMYYLPLSHLVLCGFMKCFNLYPLKVKYWLQTRFIRFRVHCEKII